MLRYSVSPERLEALTNSINLISAFMGCKPHEAASLELHRIEADFVFSPTEGTLNALTSLRAVMQMNGWQAN